MVKEQAIFLQRWKQEMWEILKSKYGKRLSKDKIEKLLDKSIERRLNNRQCHLVNNYSNKSINTNILSVIDLVIKHNLIIGGGGTIFIQHASKENPIIDYILEIMALRGKHKHMRDTHKKYSMEWIAEDLLQSNYKIKINSLYGVLGYMRFIFFNIFLAEAVTGMGQNIISSAACGFENFLSDNINFVNMNEFYHYINNIKNEYKNNYKDIDFSFIPDVDKETVLKRLVKKVDFDITQEQIDSIKMIINNVNINVLKLLYYKNNLFEFSRLNFIKQKIAFIVQNIGTFNAPDIRLIQDDRVKTVVEDLWKFYELFVFYNYPTYDRIRRIKYTYRKSVLYIDTDSNMISLNKWILFIKNEVLSETLFMNEANLDFISANILTLYLTNVVSLVLQNMCDYMHISRDFSKMLKMKNEYFFKRMLFVNRKKRYLAQMILQEGILLNDGKGLPEIKGFDFIKSTTKPTIKNIYTDICENDILSSKKIDIRKIHRKIMNLQSNIEESLRRGDTIYYKQSNVGIIEKYKKPYSQQGIKGVILWNSLFPQYSIELPMDLDIVPIKSLSDKKNLTALQSKHPHIYKIIEEKFIFSNNPDMQKMELNVLAKPKNSDLELPDWYYELIDSEKIVDDAISLFNPILESIGINILQTTSKLSHISNMVSI